MNLKMFFMFVVVVCISLGQVMDTTPRLPILDQQCPPDGGKLNSCLGIINRVSDFREYQQRITVGRNGTLAKIEITTCEEVLLVVGLSRGEPWIGIGDGNSDTAIWEITTVGVTGDPCYNGYIWVPIDLSILSWHVQVGDQLTLHIWPPSSGSLQLIHISPPS